MELRPCHVVLYYMSKRGAKTPVLEGRNTDLRVRNTVDAYGS